MLGESTLIRPAQYYPLAAIFAKARGTPLRIVYRPHLRHKG